MKCYWILSDDKTVREISIDEYREKAVKDMNRTEHTHLLVVLGDAGWINIVKGKHIVTLPVEPLRQILNGDGGETVEA